jgi:GNAT superfamily N-acetyltransferase
LLELVGSDSQISVFRLEADDWPTLRQLRLLALQDSPEAFLGAAPIERKYDEGHWRRELRRHIWFVAGLHGEPVGLAKLNRAPEQNDGMHMEAMWVAPGVRRRGVGEVLASALESAAAALGVRRLRLWVFADNGLARDFYLQLGYAGPVRVQTIKVNDRLRIEEEYVKQVG